MQEAGAEPGGVCKSPRRAAERGGPLARYACLPLSLLIGKVWELQLHFSWSISSPKRYLPNSGDSFQWESRAWPSNFLPHLRSESKKYRPSAINGKSVVLSISWKMFTQGRSTLSLNFSLPVLPIFCTFHTVSAALLRNTSPSTQATARSFTSSTPWSCCLSYPFSDSKTCLFPPWIPNLFFSSTVLFLLLY